MPFLDVRCGNVRKGLITTRERTLASWEEEERLAEDAEDTKREDQSFERLETSGAICLSACQLVEHRSTQISSSLQGKVDSSCSGPSRPNFTAHSSRDADLKQLSPALSLSLPRQSIARPPGCIHKFLRKRRGRTALALLWFQSVLSCLCQRCIGGRRSVRLAAVSLFIQLINSYLRSLISSAREITVI